MFVRHPQVRVGNQAIVRVRNQEMIVHPRVRVGNQVMVVHLVNLANGDPVLVESQARVDVAQAVVVQSQASVPT